MDDSEQGSTLGWLVWWSTIYLFLLWFVGWFIFDITIEGIESAFQYSLSDFMSFEFLASIVFTSGILAFPYSLPVALFFMWLRYFQKKYDKAIFHCAVPFFTFCVSFFLFFLSVAFISNNRT